MVNFGPFGAPQQNFNGFHVLASLLQRRHSTEANQILNDVWPSPGLVHYIYIFDGVWMSPLIQMYCLIAQVL